MPVSMKNHIRSLEMIFADQISGTLPGKPVQIQLIPLLPPGIDPSSVVVSP